MSKKNNVLSSIKPPLQEVMTGGTIMSRMYMADYDKYGDIANFKLEKETLESFGIPPIMMLVNDSIPYRNQSGESGWFIIRALSTYVMCHCYEGYKNVGSMIQLIGYLESPKFLGLAKNIKGAISCPNCGWYQTFPKELIDFVIEQVKTKGIPPSSKPVNNILEILEVKKLYPKIIYKKNKGKKLNQK